MQANWFHVLSTKEFMCFMEWIVTSVVTVIHQKLLYKFVKQLQRNNLRNTMILANQENKETCLEHMRFQLNYLIYVFRSRKERKVCSQWQQKQTKFSVIMEQMRMKCFDIIFSVQRRTLVKWISHTSTKESGCLWEGIVQMHEQTNRGSKRKLDPLVHNMVQRRRLHSQLEVTPQQHLIFQLILKRA